MTKQLKLVLPLEVYLPRKTKADKKVILNLNNYRNQQRMVENQCKKAHKQQVEQYMKDNNLLGITFDRPVNVIFQYFKPTRRISDKSNVYTVQAKYVYDALTELGVWDDDNDDQIKIEILLETIHDKENPRVEFVFVEVNEDISGKVVDLLLN